MDIITRFAPAPTGLLHIGNIRTAFVNWLYTRKMGGKFYIRIDDTDIERSKQEFIEAIYDNMHWLGLTWDLTFKQSDRREIYKTTLNRLIKEGCIYPCYESSSELELIKKIQLSRKLPPIYSRDALKLSQSQKEELENQGRKPHYRFMLSHEPIVWEDMVKGHMHFEGRYLSDPVVVKEDGNMTYLLCSAIDDLDYNVSTILRGEDHVHNTAIQIQMMKSLKANFIPNFGHLSLVKAEDNKISKRTGGFDINSLKNEFHLEAKSILSFLSRIGTNKPLQVFSSLQEIIDDFDIASFSKSPTTYMAQELKILNHKVLSVMHFYEIEDFLNASDLKGKVLEEFWLSVRSNLKDLEELKDWYHICYEEIESVDIDKEYLSLASELLPDGEITDSTFKVWTTKLSKKTAKKGKELFYPLRIALTGREEGPEMHNLLPIIGREKILERLKK